MGDKLRAGILCLGALVVSLGAGPVYSLSDQETPPPTGESSTTPAAPPDGLTATPSLTTTSTPTETPTPTATPLPSEEPSASPTLTLTPTPDSTLPEVTTTDAPTVTPTSTPTQPLVGFARYQNRAPDQGGITVTVLSSERVVLATTTTDSYGLFEIVVPGGVFYWLVIDAPLHQLVVLSMEPDSMLPETVTLAGGDLDDDGCINTTDLALLTASFGAERSEHTDINADDRTDLTDLAILSGNYDPECIPVPGLIPTATPTATPESTLTPTVVTETTVPATNEP